MKKFSTLALATLLAVSPAAASASTTAPTSAVASADAETEFAPSTPKDEETTLGYYGYVWDFLSCKYKYPWCH